MFERIMKRLGKSRVPTPRKFDQLFREHILSVDSCNILLTTLFTQQNTDATVRQIKSAESEADKLVADTHILMSNTFILPYPAEDIVALITAQDNIADSINQAAHQFQARRLFEFDWREENLFLGSGLRFQELLAHQIRLIKETLERLPNIKHDFATEQARQINQLEDNADHLFYACLSLIHDDPDRPITSRMHGWEQVFKLLEVATDNCQHAGDALQNIVAKL